MAQPGATSLDSARGRWLAAGALLAPFLLAWPQMHFIPSWYEPLENVPIILFLLHVAVAALTLLWVVRRSWGWPRRILSALGLVLLVPAAFFATWAANERDVTFLCDRHLAPTVDCPEGGQVFVYDVMCIAGNPEQDILVRPNALPFMYPTAWKTSIPRACAMLRP